MSSGWKKLFLGLLMLSFFSLTACATTGGIPSNYDERAARASELQSVLLLTPDIKVNSLSAGDVKEEMPEWSEQARQLVIRTVKAEMEARGRKLKILDPQTRYRETVNDVKDLHLAVMSSIYEHTIYEPGNLNIFPQRIEHFDYSVGSVEKLLKAYRVDGMLIIRGEDNISTSGRKALGVVSALNPFSQGQMGGMTFLEATLTDASGDVLWFVIKWNAGDYDLRDSEEAVQFVHDMFADFEGGDS
jgi:hypothetical protein